MSSNMHSPELVQRQLRNGVYLMITREKEIENDRDRILKKFCFNNRSNTPHNDYSISKSQKKTLSETKYKSPKTPKSPSQNQMRIFPYKGVLNTRNKSANCRHDYKSLSFNYKQNSNIGTTKDITRKTNQSSHLNSPYSEDTEKESKNHLMLVTNKLSDEFKTTDNNNCIYDKISNSSLIQLDSQKKILDRNNYLPISNENSSLSSPNSQNNPSKSITNNENFIHQYNQDNIMFIGYTASQIKHRKMQQLFSSNANYDISNRFLNDEIYKNHHIEFKNNFKFIKDVKEDNDKLRKIQLVTFLKMSDYSIYTLLSFAYESFDALVFNSNKFISTKINLCLNNIFDTVINGFKESYCNVIQLEEFHFKQKTFKRSRCLYPILDLVFRAKVITNEYDKGYEIGYNYVKDGNEYDQKWRFEIKQKSKNVMMWLASEVEVYNKLISRFCYSQPIGSYVKGDILEFRMNIFSKQSELNPFSIKWKPMTSEPSSKGFYQKSLLKCSYAYDALYACEIENMIHIWKSGQALENKMLIQDFSKYYMKHFVIRDVVYDYSKIYFYKFRMKANREGKIKRNHYVNFDIEIIDNNKSTKNEIQTLGLLNSSLISDCIQIRKGAAVVFYITDFIYN